MGEKIYGQWAGNPKGVKQNPERCIEEVMNGWHTQQCTRKKKVGDYCTRHAKKHQKGSLIEEKKNE